MKSHTIPSNPGLSQDGLKPGWPTGNGDQDTHHIDRTIEDDRARTPQFVSKKLVWIDDFGISLND